VHLIKFAHDYPESIRPPRLLPRIKMTDQVAADPAKNFSHRNRYQMVEFRRDVVTDKEVPDVIGAPETPALEWINVQRIGTLETADQEVSRQADGLEFDTQTLANQYVNGGKEDRDSLSPTENGFNATIEGIFVIFGVATKSRFMKKDPIDHFALLARRHVWQTKVTTALRKVVQSGTDRLNSQLRVNDAVDQEQTRFQFIAGIANKLHQHAGRVRAIQDLEKPDSMRPGRRFLLTNGLLQNTDSRLPEPLKFLQQSRLDYGGVVFQEAYESPFMIKADDRVRHRLKEIKFSCTDQ